MKGTFINLTYWEFIFFLIGYKWTNISSDLPWQRSTAWRDVSTLLWACLHSSNRILTTIWVYLSSRFFKELRLCFVHSRIHRQTLCKAGYVTQASAVTCATWMDSKSACKVRNTSFGRGGGYLLSQRSLPVRPNIVRGFGLYWRPSCGRTFSQRPPAWVL